jgi:hypothetical protein
MHGQTSTRHLGTRLGFATIRWHRTRSLQRSRAGAALAHEERTPPNAQIGRSNAACRIVTPRSPPMTAQSSSTVAKLVEALKRSIPKGSENAERKKEALRLGRELLRETRYGDEQ